MYTFRRVEEIEAGRAPQVLTIDHDDSEAASSSDDDDDDDDDVSDEEVAACSERFQCPTPLSQPDYSLPGIASGQLGLFTV